MTTDGVLRETRYEEKMIRRRHHVWIARVLPVIPLAKPTEAHSDSEGSHQHRHPNYQTLPRHVYLDAGKVRLEVIDARAREVIAVPPAEYGNVEFDGSWEHSFFLIDPKRIAAMPLSKRPSAVQGARWRQQEKNGVFQFVLWDEKRLIPLEVENRDRVGTYIDKVSIKPLPKRVNVLPWTGLARFAKKEYTDFLD